MGDRYIDIQTAANAGVKGILVLTGYGRGEYEYLRAAQPVQPVQVAPDLWSAVEWIWQDLGKNPRRGDPAGRPYGPAIHF